MKYQFIKASWFGGTPFIWNATHTNTQENKTVKIFRFGPLLIRVEK